MQFVEWGLGVAAFLAAWFLARWARPLGGIIYAATSLPSLIPFVGDLYRSIVIEMLQISYAAKLVGMIVSASGMLILVEAVRVLTPGLMSHPGVLAGLFAATTVSVLEVLQRMHLLEMPDFEGALSGALKFMPQFAKQARDQQSRLAHVHFIEVAIVDFLIIVVGLGVTLFLADQLHLFSHPAHIANSGQGMLAALKSAQVDLGGADAPQGAWAYIIRGFYGLSLLFYTAVFLSVAPNLIPTENHLALEGSVEAFLKGYLARDEAPKISSSVSRPASPRWQHALPPARKVTTV